MQRRAVLMIISAVLALVGVVGVYAYAKGPSRPAARPPAQPPAQAQAQPAPASATATPSPATAGLAIPPGLMAVAVTASPIAAVAGHLEENSQIAIFDTFPATGKAVTPSARKDAESTADNWVTRLLVPRATVLAVAARGTDSGQQNSQQQNGRMITVAVGQADAERLIHVAQTGRLYFALLTGTSKLTPGGGVDNQGGLGQLFGTDRG